MLGLLRRHVLERLLFFVFVDERPRVSSSFDGPGPTFNVSPLRANVARCGIGPANAACPFCPCNESVEECTTPRCERDAILSRAR